MMPGEVHLQSRSSVKVNDVFLAFPSMDTFSLGVQDILGIVVAHQLFVWCKDIPLVVIPLSSVTLLHF